MWGVFILLPGGAKHGSPIAINTTIAISGGAIFPLTSSTTRTIVGVGVGVGDNAIRPNMKRKTIVVQQMTVAQDNRES